MSTLSAAIHATVYRGGGDPSLIFNAPLLTSVVAGKALSTGVTVTSEATYAEHTHTDNLGFVSYCAPNEVRFSGARREMNLVLTTNVIDDATYSWRVGACTKVADTDDATGRGAIFSGIGNNESNCIYGLMNIVGRYDEKFWHKTKLLVVFEAKAPVGQEEKTFIIDLKRDGGTFASVSCRYTLPNHNNYQKYFLLASASTSDLTTLMAKFVIRGDIAGWATSIGFRNPQLHVVPTTITDKLVEFITVRESSSPFHGANADGVRYFSSEKPTFSYDSTGATVLTGTGIGGVVTSEVSGGEISNASLYGYLAEPEGTNLVTRSETCETPYWILSGNFSAMTLYAADAPDGSGRASTLTENTATTVRYHAYIYSSAAPADDYAVSIYAKPLLAGREWCKLAITARNASNVDLLTWHSYFNLDTGALGGVSGTPPHSRWTEPAANGFRRCVLTAKNMPANTAKIVFWFYGAGDDGIDSYIGSGNPSYAIWGGQIEKTCWVSSYIRTTTAAVTRSFGQLEYPWANISGIDAEGSLISECRHRYSVHMTGTRGLVSTGGNGGLVVSQDASGDLTNYDGTGYVSYWTGATVAFDRHKVGMTWKSGGNRNSYRNGASVIAGGGFDGTMLDSAHARFLVGTLINGSAGNVACANIKNLSLFNAEKPSAFMLAETA